MFLLSLQNCKVYYQFFDLNMQGHTYTLEINRDECLNIYDPLDNKRQYKVMIRLLKSNLPKHLKLNSIQHIVFDAPLGRLYYASS